MASYKIANIKYLRDLGWEIADTYSDSFCPTYSDITTGIPVSGISSVSVNETCTATAQAYASSQLVCEIDITVTLCYAPDIAVTSETWIDYNRIQLNLGFVDTSVKALLTQQDGKIIKIPANGSAGLTPNEVQAYSATTVSVYVGPTVTSIEYGAVGSQDLGCFQNFSNLESVILADSVLTVDFDAFNNTKIINLDFLNKVESLYIGAFENCYELQGRIKITDNVKWMDREVFNGCSGITEIVFSENSKLERFASNEMYGSATSGCTNISKVVLPSSLQKIGPRTFQNTPTLTSITFNATTPPEITGGQNHAFDNTNNCPIYVPAGSVNAYKTANKWSDCADRIQAIP